MPDRRLFLTALGAAGTLATTRALALDRLGGTALADLERLEAELKGELLLPSAQQYDRARRVFSFNPRTDLRPALIVRAADDEDVARAIGYARTHGLPLAVRAGGHDVLGLSANEGGMVIDLRGLADIQVAGDRARIGAGVLAGALNARLVEDGRAVALGCNDLPGVGGLTLGGGIGWFAGVQGATCDALVGARVVTADGRIVTASADENPELLWALKGGGGNFGVVTELEFETFPARDVTGGMIVFDGERLADFLRFYGEFMASRPEELVVEVIVRGIERRFIVANFCFAGGAEGARKALAPLRRFAEPLAEGITTGPYPRAMDPTAAVNAAFGTDAPRPQQANDGPGIHWLGGVLPEITDQAIEVIVARLQEADFDWAFNIGHHHYGAYCRSGADDSALPRPEGSFTFHFDSWWSAAARAKPQMAWVDDSMRAIAPHMGPDYINYMSTTEAAAVRRAYADRYERLRGVKRSYDPDNVFRGNRNIS